VLCPLERGRKLELPFEVGSNHIMVDRLEDWTQLDSSWRLAMSQKATGRTVVRPIGPVSSSMSCAPSPFRADCHRLLHFDLIAGATLAPVSFGEDGRWKSRRPKSRESRGQFAAVFRMR
jgi:hypothetical protein